MGRFVAAEGQQLLGGGVALRVDGGLVQRVFAAGDAQKSSRLLVGLGPQFGHRQQVPPLGKGAQLLPPGDDVLGHSGRNARNLCQQGGGGGVQIHPHGVDTVLHHPFQGLAQLLFGHVVLVLPHADGLGVDLHQLS